MRQYVYKATVGERGTSRMIDVPLFAAESSTKAIGKAKAIAKARLERRDGCRCRIKFSSRPRLFIKAIENMGEFVE